MVQLNSFQKNLDFIHFPATVIGTSNNMLDWPEARWVIIDLAGGQINYPLSGKQYSLLFPWQLFDLGLGPLNGLLNAYQVPSTRFALLPEQWRKKLSVEKAHSGLLSEKSLSVSKDNVHRPKSEFSLR